MPSSDSAPKKLTYLPQLHKNPTEKEALAQLAHDLATPLTIFSLNLDLLTQELEQNLAMNPKLTKLLDRLSAGNSKLQNYLKQIQDEVR